MVMGPSCGLVLADLGADVIKIEPVGEGDNTRRLPGSGAGFFPTFNRNKRSLALDIKSPKGLAFARTLIARSDVLIENFRPGGLDAAGLGYEALKAVNPGLIYCSLKGFLSGPYEHRAALDEVVQMMGGLAYMTGPPGRPLRAGASGNDIMGGMFAVKIYYWPTRHFRPMRSVLPRETGSFRSCATCSSDSTGLKSAASANPKDWASHRSCGRTNCLTIHSWPVQVRWSRSHCRRGA